MADRSAEGTKETTAFEAGKEQVKQLASSAAAGPLPQRMIVLLLSDLETTLFDSASATARSTNSHTLLASRKPGSSTSTRSRPLRRARRSSTRVQQGQKVLHFVSDFRENDWAIGPGVENLNGTVDRLLADGIHLSLIDAAAPARGKTRKVALNHDNLAIVGLKAEARVAAEGVPLQFTAKVHNFSPSQKTGFLEVRVDGQPDLGATTPVPNLPPNESTEVKFQVLFIKKKLGEEVRPGDSRETEAPPRPRVRAGDGQIEPEPTGLDPDNVRDMVIEVRSACRRWWWTATAPRGAAGGDYFHLESRLRRRQVLRGRARQGRGPRHHQPRPVPEHHLPQLAGAKKPEGDEKLDEYVKNGGSVCYFLGEKVKPAFYNESCSRRTRASSRC